MQEIKNTIGVIAVLLVFIGYIPYFRSIFTGRTRPHIYSWFVWGFVATIVFALQISNRAGAGAFVTLAAAVLSFSVLLLSLRHGKRDITKTDTVFLVLALLVIVIWLFAKQPVFSIMLASTIDFLGFFPTIRKSWKDPYSETIIFYLINSIRFTLAIFALQTYTIVTALYPSLWLSINTVFVLMLITRRRLIPPKAR